MTVVLVSGVVALAGCSSDAGPDDSGPTTSVVATAGDSAPVLSSATDPSTAPAPTTTSAAPTTAASTTPPSAEPVSITCAALASLSVGVDDAALSELIAVVVEDNELLLPAAIRVLSDPEVDPTVRALAVDRMAFLVAADDCDHPAAPDRVIVQPDGVAVGFGVGDENPALVVPFGAERSAAVAPVTLLLGAPNVDTGPIDPFSVYGTCGGAQLWAVEWPGLVMLFSDDGEGPESFELTTWRTYRQDDIDVPDELIPRTAAGVGVGSTLDEVVAAYPQADRFFDELALGEAASVEEEMWFIAGDGSSTVTFVEAGFLCGE